MKNSQQADNHVLRNDEALIGWYWTGGSTTSKDTWRAGARSPNPYPFLFYFIFNFKVGFNAKLLIIYIYNYLAFHQTKLKFHIITFIILRVKLYKTLVKSKLVFRKLRKWRRVWSITKPRYTPIFLYLII